MNYVVQTTLFGVRFSVHNQGRIKYTSKGKPWKWIKVYYCKDRSMAVQLERKVKKRGIFRYLYKN